MNRLTNLVWKAGNTALGSFAYTLGATGNRTALAETLNGINRSYAWSYDDLYRLTGENLGSLGAVNYKYDSGGNRTNRTSTVSQLSNTNSSYNANDWLTSDMYDDNGNTVASSANTYEYDVMNRLTNVNSGSILIGYDGDGNRASKMVGGTTTYYLVDDVNPSGYPQVLEEYRGSTLTNVYNYALDLISQRVPGTSTNYFIYDGHGSTRILADAGGNVANVFTYDAYGTLIASNGTPQTCYLYCGQQFDTDLGLYYNRARYLNVGTGRFWTMDGTEGDNEDPLSLHKYLYCELNPLNGADPSGHNNISYTADSLSILNTFTSLSIVLPGLTFGTGGPDVTKILKRTMLEVQRTYLSWSESQQAVAAAFLTIPSTGRGAWDILTLKEIGFGESSQVDPMNGKSYPAGSGLAAGTVTVKSAVYYAGSVNYTLWGTMCRAIHDNQVLRYGHSAWSLSFAKHIVAAWKSVMYGDSGDTAKEALAFTEYGYNGNLPSAGLPFKPSNQELAAKGDILDWCWLPYKARDY